MKILTDEFLDILRSRGPMLMGDGVDAFVIASADCERVKIAMGGSHDFVR